MEEEAIKKGFENLKDGKEYDALYEAELCREPECKEGKTTEKKHFTEDTLLSMMEHASADDMPEDAEIVYSITHKKLFELASKAGAAYQ